MPPSLRPRANNNDDDFNDNDDGSWWWYSGTAVAIKWAILAGIILFFLLFFLGAYYHAQRRMKKNLAPLPYHRWLLPRSQRARFEPHLLVHYHNYNIDGYNLNQYPAPPPAYNSDTAPPPVYAPPENLNKEASGEAPAQRSESSQMEPAAPAQTHLNGTIVSYR